MRRARVWVACCAVLLAASCNGSQDQGEASGGAVTVQSGQGTTTSTAQGTTVQTSQGTLQTGPGGTAVQAGPGGPSVQTGPGGTQVQVGGADASAPGGQSITVGGLTVQIPGQQPSQGLPQVPALGNLPGLLPQAGGAPGAIVCSSDETITRTGETISNPAGDAVNASGNCHVNLVNCTVTGAIGINASGNATVTLNGGTVTGTQFSLMATGNATVSRAGTALNGPVHQSGSGTINGT